MKYKTLVLTSCTKRKRREPGRAKEVYIGPVKHLFSIAEKLEASCFVFSAKHGLISCDDYIEPYDTYLGELNDRQLTDLLNRVRERCHLVKGPWDLAIIHFSKTYAKLFPCEIKTKRAIVIGAPIERLNSNEVVVLRYKNMGERAKILKELDEKTITSLIRDLFG